MGGFRSLFKVRKPGNGNAVQKGFEANSKKRVSIANKPMNPPTGGTKTAV